MPKKDARADLAGTTSSATGTSARKAPFPAAPKKAAATPVVDDAKKKEDTSEQAEKERREDTIEQIRKAYSYSQSQ